MARLSTRSPDGLAGVREVPGFVQAWLESIWDDNVESIQSFTLHYHQQGALEYLPSQVDAPDVKDEEDVRLFNHAHPPRDENTTQRISIKTKLRPREIPTYVPNEMASQTSGITHLGTLFGQKKFYLSLKVPMRNYYIDSLKARFKNGGIVVPLERDADYIISDPARKDAPIGSYSWKFIEDSLKKGVAQDIEQYLAGPPAGSVRPVGSRIPGKTTRTPFTAGDDLILYKWVTNAEKKGMATKGNEIYEQLERILPHHTYQSWRDRWLKTLSHRPPPDESTSHPHQPVLSQIAAGPAAPKRRSEVPGPEANLRGSRHQINSMPARIRPPSQLVDAPAITPKRRQTSNSSKEDEISSASGDKPLEGQPFTAEDDMVLDKEYEDIINIDPALTIAAWERFADNYDQHTAKEWIEYFHKVYLAKRRKRKSRKQLPQIKSSKEAAPNVRSSPSNPVLPKTAISKTSKSELLRQGERDIPPNSTSRSNYLRKSSPMLTNLGKSKNPALSSPLQGAATKVRDAPNGKNKHGILKSDIETDFRKKHFFDYLAVFVKGQGIEAVEEEADICGQGISLYDINRAVMDFGGFDRVEGKQRWIKVAKKLNIDPSRYEEAIRKLRYVFDHVLADFAEWKEKWFQIEATLPSEEDSEVEETVQTSEEDDFDDDLNLPSYLPSSPPVAKSKKRTMPASFGSPDLGLGTQSNEGHNKRQRTDQGKENKAEIPSTPEYIYNSGFRTQKRQNNPSPVSKKVVLETDEAAQMIQSNSFVIPTQRKSFSDDSAKTKYAIPILEPETQDFHFPQFADEDLYSSPLKQIKDVILPSEANDAPGPQEDDTATQSQDETQVAAEAAAYIDHCISLGYPEEVVIDALEATTMDRNEVMFVMQEIMDGRGIPKDTCGVWTAEDDAAVRLPKGDRQYRKIAKKHGQQRCDTRLKFLQDQDEYDE